MAMKKPTTPKMNAKRTTKKIAKTRKDKPKMSYATVGTIKSIDLSNRTFTLEPISKYRFEKEDDVNSWKIVFVDESSKDPDDLKLIPNDTPFPFDVGLESAMVVLKQGKGKIKLVLEKSHLDNLIESAKVKDAAGKPISGKVGPVKIEVL